MIVIRHKIGAYDDTRPQSGLYVDRHILNKTRWRGVAEDGTEFGFDLEAPLKHGDAFFETDSAVFLVYQKPEQILEVGGAASWTESAKLAWSIGNLHLPAEFRPDGLRMPDEPALRAVLDKMSLKYKCLDAVFQPQGGNGHTHHEDHAYD